MAESERALLHRLWCAMMDTSDWYAIVEREPTLAATMADVSAYLTGNPPTSILHAPTLEAAAKVADAAAATEWSEGGHYQRDDYQRGLREHAGHKLTQAAAAIRALAKREN